jgi:hypothetical protein
MHSKSKQPAFPHSLTKVNDGTITIPLTNSHPSPASTTQLK